MTLGGIFYLVFFFYRVIIYVRCNLPYSVFLEYPGFRRVRWVALSSCDVYHLPPLQAALLMISYL